MPASYTHTLYGEKVYQRLSDDLKQKISPYKKFYDMGLYGPDILFFYQPYHHHPLNRQGYQMHEEDAYYFFDEARQLIKTSKNSQAALAYICGFMNHFILDSECHGYIGLIEKKMNASHAEIEADLDRQLLVNEGYIPHKEPVQKYIHTDQDIAEMIAPFFHRTTKEMHKVLKSMKFYLGLLHCPHKFKLKFLFVCMKIVGAYDSMHGMVIVKDANEKCQESTQHLIKLFNQSIDLSIAMIDEYIRLLDTDLDLNERLHRNFE